MARTPLWPTRFAVYASPQFVHACHRFLPITALSALGATLATGGWLALTRNHFRPLSRPGLAPGKKRQASLGAPRPDPAPLGTEQPQALVTALEGRHQSPPLGMRPSAMDSTFRHALPLGLLNQGRSSSIPQGWRKM